MARKKKEETKDSLNAVKSKKEIAKERNKKILKAEQLIKQDKKYAGQKFVRGNDDFLKVQKIPTGIYQIDKATYGGVPQRRITLFWGVPSSFKSTVAYKTVAQAQRFCRLCFTYFDLDYSDDPNGKPTKCPECGSEIPYKCLWVDAEKSYDEDYAKQLGVITEDLLFLDPDSGENVIGILEVFLENEIDLIVIDSLAALTPRKELEKDADKEKKIGSRAQLISGLFDRILNYFSGDYPPAIIAINQSRDDIGGRANPYMPTPQRKPGGKSQEFLSSLTLRHHKGRKKDALFTDEGQKSRKEMYVEVEKSKVSPEHDKMSILFHSLDDGVHRLGETNCYKTIYDDFIDQIKEVKDGIAVMGKKFKNKTAFKDALKNDAKLRWEALNYYLKNMK
jgi:recombination protein RecA